MWLLSWRFSSVSTLQQLLPVLLHGHLCVSLNSFKGRKNWGPSRWGACSSLHRDPASQWQWKEDFRRSKLLNIIGSCGTLSTKLFSFYPDPSFSHWVLILSRLWVSHGCLILKPPSSLGSSVTWGPGSRDGSGGVAFQGRIGYVHVIFPWFSCLTATAVSE